MQEQLEDWYLTMYEPTHLHNPPNANTVPPVARQNHPHLPRPHHAPHISHPLIYTPRLHPLLRQLGQNHLVLVHQHSHPPPTLLRTHRLRHSPTNPPQRQRPCPSHLRQRRRQHHNLARLHRRKTPHLTRPHARNPRSSNRPPQLRYLRTHHNLQRRQRQRNKTLAYR